MFKKSKAAEERPKKDRRPDDSSLDLLGSQQDVRNREISTVKKKDVGVQPRSDSLGNKANVRNRTNKGLRKVL